MTAQTYLGKEIFPIKTQTACILKWSWSTINMQEGFTSSCHRVHDDFIDPNNFKNFHNTPSKIQARKTMAAGEWPGHGCEYCKHVEQAGGTSDRLMSLMQHHTADKVPPELYVDPNAVEVTPTILEIYFDNTCNLSCVYCVPGVSSKINDELSRHGPINIGPIQLTPYNKNQQRYQKMVNDLWAYLEENNRYQVIRHYNILGGEPLLQKELDSSIDFWQQHPNPSLTFNLITNLMLPPKLFQEKMYRFQQLVESNSILTVEITASIDCWGPEQEYVRWGIDLDGTWIKNFEFLLDKPWVRLAIHSCINSLTIKPMPQLLEKINKWNTMRPDPVDHSFDLVIGSTWNNAGMHPRAFGQGVFDNDMKKILDLMPVTTPRQQAAHAQMQGVAQLISQSQQDPQQIKILQLYLDELDKRRGTTWRTTFPWLDKEWD